MGYYSLFVIDSFLLKVQILIGIAVVDGIPFLLKFIIAALKKTADAVFALISYSKIILCLIILVHISILQSCNRIMPVHKKTDIIITGFFDGLVKAYIPYVGKILHFAYNPSHLVLSEMSKQICCGFGAGKGCYLYCAVIPCFPSLICKGRREAFLRLSI